MIIYNQQLINMLYTTLIILNIIIFSTLGQDDETVRMSTTACDPQNANCSQTPCQDVAPTSMTLTCEQVATNNLCELQSITDGKFCQKSCGTCDGDPKKCFTTMFGCECLKNWEFQSKSFSGCENPDNDAYGSWCEIKPNSCSEVEQNTAHRIKIYDYCAENCAAIQLIPPQIPQVQEKSPVVAPPTASKPEASNYDVKIVAVSGTAVVITNFGQSQVDLTGWKFVNENMFGRTTYGIFGVDKCFPTILKAGEPLRLIISDSSTTQQCDELKNFQYSSVIVLLDDQERAISRVNFGFNFNNIQLAVFCRNGNGVYDIVDGSQCEWY
eukprot:TRINITY_DN6521_c2_g1_i4.p2 TRINITY_DN6521_c2_g1~~TRINITY_DN6521_c2_g1_i4.p2  ORF type:complete len:326 (-),score=28.02 TRINITY_DN6521_c2_g1_i4:1079-2056(-)